MTNSPIGDRLLSLLKEKEVSQAELARRSGRSKAAISDIISGRRNMSADFAIDLADAFNVPPEDFFRMFDLLPPKRETNPIAQSILYNAVGLPEDEQKEILEIVLLKRRMAEERGTYKTIPRVETTGND